MKTRNKILFGYAAFAFMNVALAWVAFFVTDSHTTPDTLLTLVLGVGGLIDVMTAAITVADLIQKGKVKKSEKEI